MQVFAYGKSIENTHQESKKHIGNYRAVNMNAGKLYQHYQNHQMGCQRNHRVADRNLHMIDALQDSIRQRGKAVEDHCRRADQEHDGSRRVRIPVQEIENRSSQGCEAEGAGNADQHHHTDGILCLSAHLLSVSRHPRSRKRRDH